MVTPVLDEGKYSVDAYVPEDTWYDYHTVSGRTSFLNERIS